MSDLPDELWGKILSLGIKNSKFTYEDLCSISLSCKLLYRLSGDDSLWSHLLSSDFPRPISPIHYSFLSSSSSSPKFQYKIRFKRKRRKEKLLAALRSAVLELERITAVYLSEVVEPEWQLQFSFDSRQDSEIEEQTRAELQKENQIAIISAKIQEIELAQENRKRKPTVAEYFNLPKREEEKRLHTAKKDLVSMNYHPLLDYKLEMSADNVEAEDPAAREYLVWITDFQDVFLLDDLMKNEDCG